VNKLLKSTFVVSFSTLVSRIFGYVRDIAIASKLGAGVLNDVFVAAFRLANMFRNIFAEGALNIAFVPEFSQIMQENGKEKAMIFAAKIHSLLLLILAGFCVIAIIMMPEIIWYTTPGFRDDLYVYDLTVLLGRITFPYLFCISLAAFYGGILNSFGKFFPFAIAPAILNISCILCLYFFDSLKTSAHTLSIATLIGGVLELLWMVYFLFKNSCRLSIVKLQIDPQISKVLKNMIPIIVASGVTHINAFVSMVILSFFPGGLSYMYYADRIIQLPIALIGTAIGTVLLPMLAKSFVGKNENSSIDMQNDAIKVVMFLAIPATFALLLLSHEIIYVLFERGEFSHNATIETAKTLLLLSIGLPAFILIKVFQTNFYSKLNTKLPVILAIICIFINLAISLMAMDNFKYLGVAAANSIAGWVNFLLLLIFATRSLGFKLYRKTMKEVLRYLTAAVVMLLMIWCIQNNLYFENKYICLSIKVFIGFATYVCSCHLLKVQIIKIKR
jgi:putative peptidoglycan lipid II flippase